MTGDEVERIAQRVVELMAQRPESELPRMVTAQELAEFLNVSRDVVYDNADRLGAVRLGDGPKAHLRFPLDEVALRAWQGKTQRPAQPQPQRRTRTQTATDVDLIEYDKGKG